MPNTTLSMLISISWRNIWRNRIRSAVVILSIAFGLWAGVFSMALMKGMSDQRTRNAIETYLSDVQIHSDAWIADPDPQFPLRDADMITAVLDTMQAVRAYSSRLVIAGMASSANGASGVTIHGVEPHAERLVASVSEQVTDGSWFESEYSNPVVLGSRLAHKLKLRLRSRFVLTFQDASGNLTAGAFRVAGIFTTDNSTFDEATIFTLRESLATLYERDLVHEIAIIGQPGSDARVIRDALNDKLSAATAQYWGEIAPELGYADDVLAQSLYIFVLIILLAMAFGIVNSMLMAVLERRHELGMLLCIGMSKIRVFTMIVLETIFITVVGGPLGLLMAWGTVNWFRTHGIDLSIVGEGLQSMGMASVVYPALESVYYMNITVMVIVTALLASLYPARKAIKYTPAHAIRAH